MSASQLLNTVRYDKSTTKMDDKEQSYWMHFLKGDPMIGDYIRSQMRQNPTFRRELFDQPVCTKCEKFCFYHKGGVQCPTCGHWSIETVKVKNHLRGGGYK